MPDLINSLEQSGEFDALAKLKPGEPYFVLIGRDSYAPELVSQWADHNRRRTIEDFNADPPRINKERYVRECRKSTEAEVIAAEMKAFRKGDAANSSVARAEMVTYSGVELDEETKHRDAIQAMRARASSALGTAIAVNNELLELIKDDKDTSTMQLTIQICDTLRQMRELERIVQPPRVGIK